MPVPNAPTPELKEARQFFKPDGTEEFYCVAYGRRPDRKDSLRVMGVGATRVEAVLAAMDNWQEAWRSLRPTARKSHRVA